MKRYGKESVDCDNLLEGRNISNNQSVDLSQREQNDKKIPVHHRTLRRPIQESDKIETKDEIDSNISDNNGSKRSESYTDSAKRYYYTKRKTLFSRLFRSLSVGNNDDGNEVDNEHLNSQKSSEESSALVFTSDDVLMEGYLTKLSGNKYFQKKTCYYILRSDTWSLCHYRKHYDLTLIGEMPIRMSDIVLDVSDRKYPFTLEILHPGQPRSLRLSCSDKQSHMKWIHQINCAIRRDPTLASNAFHSSNLAQEKKVPYPQVNDENGNNQDEHNENDNTKQLKPKKRLSKVHILSESSSYPESTSSFSQRSFKTHCFNASGQEFELDVKYELIKAIGTGAYGAVIAVKNIYTGESVAIKKISDVFDDLVDAKRILREVRLLGHFHHKNITRLMDLPPPTSPTEFDDMYIITELMETDLHQVIYSMQPMTDDHVKYFLYQMLCSLYHIHSAGVLHRDIKPSNILLNSNCDLKICDFGLARGGFPESIELTEYVVTRWYRAPEIMLSCLNYTEAVDVWSVGCIFAEMLQREPLFPGNDYIHQLKLIIKFLGTPRQEDTSFVKNTKALRFLSKLQISVGTKFEKAFPDAASDAIDLLKKMLVFNPKKRISIEEALHHPYLSTFFDPSDITKAKEFDFGFDIADDDLTKEALIELLYRDIQVFHPDVQKAYD